MILYFISICLILVLNYNLVNSLSCKIIGDNNKVKEVNYFVAVKIPESDGKGYIYKSNVDLNSTFKHENEDIFSPNSIIAKTLTEVYANHDKFNYIMYNNAISNKTVASSLRSPDSEKSKFIANSKGVLIWNKVDNPIWLIHSVPKFSPVFQGESYGPGDSPDSFKKGHNFMCLTLPRNIQVKDIILQLIIQNAQVYKYHYLNDDNTLKSAQTELYTNKRDCFCSSKKINREKIEQHSVKQIFFGHKSDGEYESRLHMDRVFLTESFAKTPDEKVKAFEKYMELSIFNLKDKEKKDLNILEIYLKLYPYPQTINIPNDYKNKLTYVFEMTFGKNNWCANEDESKWAIIQTKSLTKLYCHSDFSREFENDSKEESGSIVCINDERLFDAFSNLLKIRKKQS